MAKGEITTGDSYIEKTSKLIPGEALALFITLSSLTWAAASVEDPLKRNFVLAIALVVAFVAIPLVLYRLQNVRSVPHYVVSVVAFLLWVVNVQYDRLPFYPDDDEPWILAASIALGLFTFLAPLLVPAREA